MSRRSFFIDPKYKPVKFDLHEHSTLLTKDTFILFKYGINLPNTYNVTGKILDIKIDDKQRTIIDAITTDKGIRTTIPEMISKIYILKDRIVNKEKRMICNLVESSTIPRLDDSIDKLIIKVKTNLPEVVIVDNKEDKEDLYNRKVTFSKNTNIITLDIISKDSNEIVVQNSMNKKNKKKHIKVTKYGIDIYSILQSIKQL